MVSVFVVKLLNGNIFPGICFFGSIFEFSARVRVLYTRPVSIPPRYFPYRRKMLVYLKVTIYLWLYLFYNKEFISWHLTWYNVKKTPQNICSSISMKIITLFQSTMVGMVVSVLVRCPYNSNVFCVIRLPTFTWWAPLFSITWVSTRPINSQLELFDNAQILLKL